MAADEVVSCTHLPSPTEESGRAEVYLRRREEHISHRGIAGMKWNSLLDCSASVGGCKFFINDRVGKQG